MYCMCVIFDYIVLVYCYDFCIFMIKFDILFLYGCMYFMVVFFVIGVLFCLDCDLCMWYLVVLEILVMFGNYKVFKKFKYRFIRLIWGNM